MRAYIGVVSNGFGDSDVVTLLRLIRRSRSLSTFRIKETFEGMNLELSYPPRVRLAWTPENPTIVLDGADRCQYNQRTYDF